MKYLRLICIGFTLLITTMLVAITAISTAVIYDECLREEER